MKGLFITFEGGEGSGKTTIINKLEQDLMVNGHSVLKTREPGGSKIAESIRNIILDVRNTEMNYMTEALLYAASRCQHLHEVIIPALNEGKIVICDRYLDSSLAYQGYARNLGIENVLNINKYAIDNVFPDLTIYIELDPQVGLNRIKNNNRYEDRLDLEKISFHEKVKEGYKEVAKMFPERVQVVDGNQTIEKVYKDIYEIIQKFLGEK